MVRSYESHTDRKKRVGPCQNRPIQPSSHLMEKREENQREPNGHKNNNPDHQKGVRNDIINNIIDLTNSKEIWEKMRAAYAQVGQSVVYCILQEFLNYS